MIIVKKDSIPEHLEDDKDGEKKVERIIPEVEAII